MKTALKGLLIALVFASCGDADTAVYDGETAKQTFISFDQEVYTLPIEADATGELVITVNSSTKSSEDRSFSVNVIAEETTASAETYSVPATIVIPADSYQGTLTITGTDVDLEEAKVLTIEFSTDDESVVFDSNRALINVTRVCPVAPGSFTGNYLITEITPFVDGPTLNHNQVVNVTQNGLVPTARKFTTRNYINYCTTTTMTFRFELVCNEVIVPSGQVSTCACNGGLTFGPAIVPSSYNPDDDSEFLLTFTNDETLDCGVTAQTTYRFVKQ